MYFDSQAHSSHNESKGVETPTPKFCAILPGFSEILPRFLTNQNFFDKSKLLGCSRFPCLLHHCRNWSRDRDQVSRLHHCDPGCWISAPNKLSCNLHLLLLLKQFTNCQITLILQTPN